MKRQTKKQPVKIEEFTSFKEFLKAVYPSLSKNHSADKSVDPFEVGVEMAKESILEINKLLSER